ncbi:MAG TPA: MBL fold metallo-hydrolase [Syntrophorhabdaceae bacterium]|nr:MBL fold metallo-hydrolase [Syntrophorhabdaceae bacterium]
MPEKIFRIEMLPANQGDAIWIEYGQEGNERRILIDGGPIGAYKKLEDRLKELPDGDKRVELLVVTHVDTDHIEGIIRLLAPKGWLVQPEDIWFNGWRHLRETQMLGGREGDFLSALIRRRAFNEWNKAFGRGAVIVKADEPLPVVELEDGMKLTLLSPYPEGLEEMADKWEKDVEKHGLMPGDLDAAWKQLVDMTRYHVGEGVLGGPEEFIIKLKKQLSTDQSPANGSSIAFLAEFEGKSCLFLADAHADVICESLKKLIPPGKKRLKVDAVKMSHHGSRHNISEDLMKLIDAKHFLISTNGSIHEHPDKPAIEAVICLSVRKPTLWFNYRSEHSEPWSKPPAGSKKSFTSKYPETEDGGIVVEL